MALDSPLMKINDLLGLPSQTLGERYLIKHLLLKLNTDSREPLNIFEYGSGNSTVYYSKLLVNSRRPFHWHAIEHDPVWFATVQSRILVQGLDSIVTLQLCLLDQFENINRYISYAKKLGKKWDMIFINGRYRRSCLLEVKNHLKPGGLVILHDAERTYYHCALKEYPYSKFITSSPLFFKPLLPKQLWVGSNEVLTF